jgi:hypothetical protein
LIVEQVDNRLDEGVHHIFYFAAKGTHAGLEHIKQYLFEVFIFCGRLIVLEHLKPCVEETLCEFFVNLAVGPKQIYRLFQNTVEEKL